MSEEKNELSRYGFGDFVLDVQDRQLWRGDTRLELTARYFDALVLLVRERGRLIGKERFFDEVWTDVVVTDSALSQCIKKIRRLLGDDAANPQYIQTVQRHGYRFIGDVRSIGSDREFDASVLREPTASDLAARTGGGDDRSVWQAGLQEWRVATIGGAFAGLFGGMLYGFGLAPADAGVGTLSTLFVLIGLNVLVGLAGGFGVGLGLGGARVASRFASTGRVPIRIAGAALGGLLVGTSAKLLGLDAFNLLFGRAPAGITGGPEGAALGAMLAFGAYVGNRLGVRSGGAFRWHVVAGSGVFGAIAGGLIPLIGGHLMGGSLDLLARSFAESRLELDRLGPIFGELHFGPATEVVLGGFEGLFFGLFVAGSLSVFARSGVGTSDTWRL